MTARTGLGARGWRGVRGVGTTLHACADPIAAGLHPGAARPPSAWRERVPAPLTPRHPHAPSPRVACMELTASPLMRGAACAPSRGVGTTPHACAEPAVAGLHPGASRPPRAWRQRVPAPLPTPRRSAPRPPLTRLEPVTASVLRRKSALHEWSPWGRCGVGGSGTRSLRASGGASAPGWSPAATGSAHACGVVALPPTPQRPCGLDAWRQV